jgi:hypothetical protein
MTKAWFRVIWMGLFGKVLAKIAAPIAVLFVDRRTHPIWGNLWTDDLGWWNSAIRNGAHNYLRRPMVMYKTTGNTKDETLEDLSGFQWRYRKSDGGHYVSFRCTWGKPRPSKGKREFYIGWTMREDFEDDMMSLTFFQLRPAWPLLLPLVLLAAYYFLR